MASVALLTVWAWKCPNCDALIRNWDQASISTNSVFHRRECYGPDFAHSPLPPAPFQTIWAFNVVNDVEGDQPGIIDSLREA